jgi:tRNA 2-selenouridine synthase
MPVRVHLLREEYPNFASDPSAMVERLAPLRPLVGAAELEHWSVLVRSGRLDEVLERILAVHYDPSYKRSRRHPSGQAEPLAQIELSTTDPGSLTEVAGDLTRRFGECQAQWPSAGT